MFFVVSYDIVDNNRRNKLAEHLLDYGGECKKSVFEFDLEKKDLDKMIEEANKYVDAEEDSMIVYHICEDCQSKTESYGRQIVREDTLIV